MRLCIIPAVCMCTVFLGLSSAPASDDFDEVQDVVFLADSGPLLIRLHVDVDGKPFRVAWREAVDRIFKLLDKDGDGVISAKELEQMPPTFLLFGSGDMQFPAKALAKENVLALGREEFANYMYRHAARPFQTHAGGGDL